MRICQEPDTNSVAQIFNLLYRGFEIREALASRPFANFGVCRMQFGDTAECNSALRRICPEARYES